MVVLIMKFPFIRYSIQAFKYKNEKKKKRKKNKTKRTLIFILFFNNTTINRKKKLHRTHITLYNCLFFYFFIHWFFSLPFVVAFFSYFSARCLVSMTIWLHTISITNFIICFEPKGKNQELFQIDFLF